jgi:osmoprotectant transport system substrate-binding protein
MYPEYIGVLLSEVAGIRHRPAQPAKALELARAFETRGGFRVLEPSPFSDSNALAVLPGTAARYKLRSIGDLDRVPGGATIAAPPEFRTRVEGLVGLQQSYGLKSVRVRALPIGAQYETLDKGAVDAAAVFTTDGQLAQRHYVLLRDPRRLFAYQQVAPIVSATMAARYGDRFVKAVDEVTRRLTVVAMRRMNAAVDLEGRTPADVARGFLAGA